MTSNVILIIEDYEQYAKCLMTLINFVHEGDFVYEFTTHIESAVKMIREKAVPYRYIFLDLNLPNGAGTQLVTRVAEITPETPIIVVTGQNGSQIQQECLENLAAAVLFKDTLSGNNWSETLETAMLEADARQVEYTTRKDVWTALDTKPID